ncbi:MAG TPA: 16S rRNA (cytosine(1402)-N(4))-methyltransferase RsmH [Clostridiales bacterium]|jgi:16S rRNA (cytosine1402-N4)-methyltransferase|nr:16S rRNA (cytosine(1402)-N(4))-methyltransferase RsmH [Clostridiales bacterium]HQP69461.1 16S rRNA (cytosine(1402)-N(4))-methyltransferase RsmH [Clostridiales bacterium]
MISDFYHIPVLQNETAQLLVTDKNGVYLDCTLGGGGHAKKLLESISEKGFLLGIDRDEQAIKYAGEFLKGFKNFKSEKISFSRLNELDQIVFGMKFDGILLDIGVSSKQIDDPERGFAYSADGELDMRMDRSAKISAFDVINGYCEQELTDIFFRYGEEKNSRKIARKIVQQRDIKPIKTTRELVDAVSSVISSNFRTKTLSRIFQAVRIEVNGELDELMSVLKFSLEILKPNGRAAVISYHSLEDRIVKQFITEFSTGCICPKNFPKCICGKVPVIRNLTKKPVCASEEEIEKNSRARSAKLRVYEKI